MRQTNKQTENETNKQIGQIGKHIFRQVFEQTERHMSRQTEIWKLIERKSGTKRGKKTKKMCGVKDLLFG